MTDQTMIAGPGAFPEKWRDTSSTDRPPPPGKGGRSDVLAVSRSAFQQTGDVLFRLFPCRLAFQVGRPTWKTLSVARQGQHEICPAEGKGHHLLPKELESWI